MTLATERYHHQQQFWPESGKHILAQFDDEHIVLYQDVPNSIGDHAVKFQKFGGDFDFKRINWVKTSFLWSMHGSNWGRKTGQETTLAMWIPLPNFRQLLDKAVHSFYQPGLYNDRNEWSEAIGSSEVRLQWDPDRDPIGTQLRRQTIQLGLRGRTLNSFATEWVIRIENVSDLVIQQRNNLTEFSQLSIPRERVMSIDNTDLMKRLHLSPWSEPVVLQH